MVKIDLHIHSSYSDDGEYTVEELIELCKLSRITCLSVTDHNSVRSVPEALALAPQYGMRAIAGVELDCVHENRNFHLLGYHFNPALTAFTDIEQSILSQEINAAEQKIALIGEALGLEISEEEVLSAAGGGAVTGELIAEILLCRENAGECPLLRPYLPGGSRCDNPYVNFYWDYFSQGRPAYVPIHYISLNEAAALIHSAGGAAVLAHPGQNLRGDYAFLNKLIETGIDGMEAYSSYHDKAEREFFAEEARKNKLFVTCGSDFHGKTKPSIPLCGHHAEGDESADILETLRILGPED